MYSKVEIIKMIFYDVINSMKYLKDMKIKEPELFWEEEFKHLNK